MSVFKSPFPSVPVVDADCLTDIILRQATKTPKNVAMVSTHESALQVTTAEFEYIWSSLYSPGYFNNVDLSSLHSDFIPCKNCQFVMVIWISQLCKMETGNRKLHAAWGQLDTCRFKQPSFLTPMLQFGACPQKDMESSYQEGCFFRDVFGILILFL